MHRRTVSDVPLGEVFHVGAVSAPPRVLRRLAELGVRAGTQLTVLRRTAGGGRILAVAGSRVAVDAWTARTIELVGAVA